MKKRQNNRPAHRPAKEKKHGFGVRLIIFLLTTVIFIFSVGIYVAAKWISEKYNVSFLEILFVLNSPLKGANTGVVGECIRANLPELALIVAYVLLGLFLVKNRPVLLKLHIRAWTHNWRFVFWPPWPLLRLSMILICVASLVFSLTYADKTLHVRNDLEIKKNPTTIYEDYYVDPNTVEITGEGKNLIYIYVESLETTYASQDAGGAQPEINYIPGLTGLAQENLSFSNSSNSEQLGGFRTLGRTGWTTSSLFAQNSGLPFSFPIFGNNLEYYEYFAPGATCLGDILAARGYQSEFLCGSDASFGGRLQLFAQHGDYKVFDLSDARAEGYVPENYWNGFWGFEDKYLYEIARDEISAMAASGKPFNFHMLTVDTHFPDGYLCDLCGDEYDSVTANVVACADRQLMDFLDWCREQDFYEDTLIVIAGDHPRNDNGLVEGIDYYDRTIYNCFLNSALSSDQTQNREFTAMDMLPTVLTAMGFQVEGDRLALGVNLFSDQPTLCESMGYGALNAETKKYAPFFIEHIA